MKTNAFLSLALAAPASGFVSPSCAAASRSRTLLSAKGDAGDGRASPASASRRDFAAATAAILGTLLPASDALAKEIKTMDFSLPSSYDSIADPVASGTDELTTSTVIKPAAPKRKPKPAAPPKEPKESSGGMGMSFDAFDPSSMFGGGGGGEKGPSKKELAKAAQEERVAARLAAEEAAKELEKQKAMQLQEDIKAARLAKIAAREAALAEEEAAAAAAAKGK